MSHQQIPIGSGFSASATAEEVVSGVDLTGKTAIVTGGYSGLGLEATRALAHAGATVVVAARREQTAREAIRGIAGTKVAEVDLADLESVRRFAEGILVSNRHIDILINNAGIMACPETRVGLGWEAQFATNHLGHYALVNHLRPALIDGSRVVSVSSAGHHISGIRWHNVEMRQGYDKWQAYGQSKTANVLFAVHLDQLGKDAGIRSFSLHPGKIFTPLQRHLTNDEMVAAGWIDANGNPADPTFKTPQQGAATQVWAATSPQLETVGGVYCEDCEIAVVSKEATFVGVREYAIDPGEAARLWDLSKELTGIDAFHYKSP